MSKARVYHETSFGETLAFAESLGWVDPEDDDEDMPDHRRADFIDDVEAEALEFIEGKGYKVIRDDPDNGHVDLSQKIGLGELMELVLPEFGMDTGKWTDSFTAAETGKMKYHNVTYMLDETAEAVMEAVEEEAFEYLHLHITPALGWYRPAGQSIHEGEGFVDLIGEEDD